MAKNTKYIILGTAVITIIVTVVLVFTLGGDEGDETKNEEEIQKTGEEKYSSMTLQEITKEALTLAEDTVTKLEKEINSKEDAKKLYKEVLPQFLNMLPEVLTKGKDYIDSKGGHEKMLADLEDDFHQAIADYAKDFEEITGKATTLRVTMEALGRNRGFTDRMERIGEAITDLDVAEIVTFTVDEYVKLINKIADNNDAIEALNWYIEVVTPEYDYDWEEGGRVWVEYDHGDGGYWDWKEGKEIKTPITPIVLTKEKLLSLSAIVENAFRNANTPRELDKAASKVEKEFKKEFGFRILDL
tara:strand:+ start:502 stop:1404 length:903 start_codon:yes stop_codon:yes gene_type:complete